MSPYRSPSTCDRRPDPRGPLNRAGARGPVPGPILFVFLDGVGVGTGDATRNPFVTAALPNLRELLGGIPTRRGEGAPDRIGAERALLLDATSGIPGLPQSGTGQTALLTGSDAPALFGGHFGPWVPVVLRPLLAERNLFSTALARGARVAFANAVAPASLTARPRLLPPTLLAARLAGLPPRLLPELAEGHAVASDLTQTYWRREIPGGDALPRRTPREAGRVLARIASMHDFTLFAHFATDRAGHRGGLAGALRTLERVDAFLGGIAEELPSGTLLVLASDHGNIEDMSTTGHTRNPALGAILRAGPWHSEPGSEGLRGLADLTPFLLERLPAGRGAVSPEPPVPTPSSSSDRGPPDHPPPRD